MLILRVIQYFSIIYSLKHGKSKSIPGAKGDQLSAVQSTVCRTCQIQNDPVSKNTMAIKKYINPRVVTFTPNKIITLEKTPPPQIHPHPTQAFVDYNSPPSTLLNCTILPNKNQSILLERDDPPLPAFQRHGVMQTRTDECLIHSLHFARPKKEAQPRDLGISTTAKASLRYAFFFVFFKKKENIVLKPNHRNGSATVRCVFFP